MSHPLFRRLVAEGVGTGLLVTAVVGSGIAAARLSPTDVGLQLLENAFATALALGVLIVVFGPVSGAHFNPVVTMADWWLHRRDDRRSALEVCGYLSVQVAGAIAGAVLANLMFALRPVAWSTTHRASPHLWLGEVVATTGLIVIVFALLRTGRTSLAPVTIAAYIGAAYWFTSSTSFANPAVSIGRTFTNTFAGIAPSSVPGFVAAQLLGAVIGLGVVVATFPPPVHPLPPSTPVPLTQAGDHR